AAYASKTWADLRELTGDLPIEPVLGADLPQRQPHQLAAAQHMVPSVPRPRQGGRDRPLGRLLPVVFVWILIAAAAGSPDTAAALSVVFICLLACRVGYGGRGDHAVTADSPACRLSAKYVSSARAGGYYESASVAESRGRI